MDELYTFLGNFANYSYYIHFVKRDKDSKITYNLANYLNVNNNIDYLVIYEVYPIVNSINVLILNIKNNTNLKINNEDLKEELELKLESFLVNNNNINLYVIIYSYKTKKYKTYYSKFINFENINIKHININKIKLINYY